MSARMLAERFAPALAFCLFFAGTFGALAASGPPDAPLLAASATAIVGASGAFFVRHRRPILMWALLLGAISAFGAGVLLKIL